jgi:NO-binding membrane sensor protein with MHYT domain
METSCTVILFKEKETRGALDQADPYVDVLKNALSIAKLHFIPVLSFKFIHQALLKEALEQVDEQHWGIVVTSKRAVTAMTAVLDELEHDGRPPSAPLWIL